MRLAHRDTNSYKTVYRTTPKGKVARVVRIGAHAVVLGALVTLILAALTALASATGVALPDERGYELVSPVAKNGVEVIPQTDKTHVAPDGNGVTFSALGGFASVEGSSFDFEYVSHRTGTPGTSGWSTHGINPLTRGTTLETSNGNNATFVDGFTPNLSAAIYKTWRPLVDAPNVAEVSNLYRVTGLTGAVRTVQLMTDSVNPIPDSWFTFLNLNGLFVRQIQPRFAGVSSDLSHVVFESTLGLTADAPPYQGICALGGIGCPTKLYENADGLVRLVGRIPNAPDTSCDDVAGPACVAAPSSQTGLGATIRFQSQQMVSRNGRRVYFQVPAAAESGALYVREDGVRTEQLATNGQLSTASEDGSRAFFITNDSLLPGDTDSSPDLYMYDRDAQAGSRLTLVSGSSITDGYVETVVGASADGHTVYFVCDGQLIPGEPPADIMGLYAWHDGELRFIGTFQDITEARRNTPRTDWAFLDSEPTLRISPDGRFLLFMTTTSDGLVGRGGFGGYDHAGHREFYLYDAQSGRLVCASCNPSGRAASADARIDVRDHAATSASTSDSAHALSDDGRWVFFNTAEALVPEDTNGIPDAYEYNSQTGTMHLLSSGRSNAPSYFIDATASGDDVFIATRERLVGWDVDDSYDLYDVRVGGGFPEPSIPIPACAGEGCRDQSSPAPPPDQVATPGSRSAGGAAARLRKHRTCGRRAVLRKVRGKRRCVRRKSHRRSHRAVDERSGR